MQNSDALIAEFTENYMEKVFYFCLKKTGSNYEAEDLSSDISLNIFSELRKGTTPDNFPAWVWQIARNRYARWADGKHRKAESVTGADIDGLELADNSLIENEYVRREDLSLLRRELAFISSDYRDIIVAYYIDDRSVNDIASSLNLPKGTVTSKLFRARSILKEGMNMAREFGVRSYKPETIYFCSSGNQPSGLPFSAVQRKAPVNILCAANNNPSTAEELSIELGIALPYTEEEIDLLVKGELLKKLDNGKYLTNFFISPKECQTEISDICCDFSQKHFTAIWKLAGIALEEAKTLGVLNGTVSEADAQMFFAFMIEQDMENSMFEEGIYGKFKRADGGSWGFIGWEQGSECKLPRQFFNNNSSYCDGKHNKSVTSNGYYSGSESYGKRVYGSNCNYVVPYEMLLVFDTLDESGGDISALSGSDRHILEKGIQNGFAVKTDENKVIPRLLVFRGDALNRIWARIKSAEEYDSVVGEMTKLVRTAKTIVEKYSVPYLKDDFDYYVYMSLTDLRDIMSMLWRDKRLYKGGNCQFAGLYYNS